jgi:hypothetical protein
MNLRIDLCDERTPTIVDEELKVPIGLQFIGLAGEPLFPMHPRARCPKSKFAASFVKVAGI